MAGTTVPPLNTNLFNKSFHSSYRNHAVKVISSISLITVRMCSLFIVDISKLQTTLTDHPLVSWIFYEFTVLRGTNI